MGDDTGYSGPFSPAEIRDDEARSIEVFLECQMAHWVGVEGNCAREILEKLRIRREYEHQRRSL